MMTEAGMMVSEDDDSREDDFTEGTMTVKMTKPKMMLKTIMTKFKEDNDY